MRLVPIDKNASVGDPLDALTQRVLHQHDAVVEAICNEVYQRRPVYASMRDKAGFKRGVSKLLKVHCATLSERRRPTTAEMVTLHVIGAQRAREGVPEEEMLASVEDALTAGWAQLVGALTDLGIPAERMKSALVDLYRLHVAFGDDLRAGLRAGFRCEVEQGIPSHVRAQSAVVDRLIDGSWTEDELFAHAREHGVSLLPPLAPLLVGGHDDVRILRGWAAAIVAGTPSVIEGTARSVETVPHVVLVANRATDSDWRHVLQRVGTVASQEGAILIASRPCDGVSKFAESYRLVAADLRFAAAARPRGGLVDGDELAMYRLVGSADPEDRVDFCVRVLGKLHALPAEKRAELVDTAETLVSVGWNATAASALIGVHYQTMRYRLRRLRETTGRDPSNAVDRLLLEMAIRIYRGWLLPIAK